MPSMDGSSITHCNGHMTHGIEALHMGSPTLVSSPGDQPDIPYVIYVSTASLKGSATSHQVQIRLVGDLTSTSFITLCPAQLRTSEPALSTSSTSALCPPDSMTVAYPSDATADTNTTFPVGSVREFLIRAPDVGNLLQIALRHASANQLDAAWKPDRILVKNDYIFRTWSFLCPRWLNHDVGNDIDLYPTGDVAAGRRASRQAIRRISTDKTPCTPTPLPQARRRFESVRERFSGGQPNSSEGVLKVNADGTRRVQFQLQRYAQTASHIYLIGSIPALGKWEPKHAVRMEKYCGLDGHWRGEWRLNLVIDDDFDEIQYRYMIVSEGASSGSRVAYLTDPTRVLRLSGAANRDRHTEGEAVYVKDSFRSERTSHSPRRMRSLPLVKPQTVSSPHVNSALSSNDLSPSVPGQKLYHSPHSLMGIPTRVSRDPTISETSVSNRRNVQISSRLAAEESSAVIGDSDSDTGDDESVRVNSLHALNGFCENRGDASPNGSQRSVHKPSNEAPCHDVSSIPGYGEISLPAVDAAPSSSSSEDHSPISSDSAEHGRDDGMVVFALRERVKSLESERSNLRNERDIIVEKCDALHLNLESLRKERDEACSETDRFRREVDVSRSEAESLKSQLQRSCEEINRERDIFLEESKSVRKERDNVYVETEELRQKLQEAKESVEALVRENEKLKEVSAFENEGGLASVKEQLRIANERNGELEEDINAKNELLSKNSEAVLALNDALEVTRTELAARDDELFRKNETCNELRLLVDERAHHYESEISQLKDSLGDMTTRWAREFKERRKLFNTVQELRGNIRVFCRVRPSKNGQDTDGSKFVSFPDASLGEHGRVQACGKSFEFDHVFQPTSTQQDVYDETAGVVVSVVDGYNVCVFAYGQTGSGKTHTMNGTESDRGVNYRALQNLFEIADQRREHCDVSVSVSMLEIYNESLRDLISPGGENGPKLEIRRDPNGASPNAVYVPNLAEVEVISFDETWDVMMKGTLNRRIGRTDMNEHSSRSHLLVRVTVRCEDHKSGVKTSGVLHLVDLAGSERVSRSNASGDRLKEAQHINKSLSSLGDVFSALLSHANHVPYRNSRLTYLLQDSLGGDSKTLMFVNISCDEDDGQETLSSLLFAQRVAKVELGNAKKHTERTGEAKAKAALSERESQNRELVAKIAGLQKDLKKRDECIMEMRQRSRDLENEVSSVRNRLDDALKHEECTRDEMDQELEEAKSAQDMLRSELKAINLRLKEMERSKDQEIERLIMQLRETENEIATLGKERDTRLNVDQELDKLKILHEKTNEALKAKDDEIRHLLTVVRTRDREIAELVKQVSKTSGEDEEDTSLEDDGRLGRQVSEPFINKRMGDRSVASVGPRRVGLTVSGRPRQVRFDESRAQTNFNERRPNHEVGYNRAASISIPAVGSNSAMVGAPRRAKDSSVSRAPSSGTIPKPTVLKTTAVRASTASGNGPARKPPYAFGTRVGASSDKYGGGAVRANSGRVPRSQTGPIAMPKRASMPVIMSNGSGAGRAQGSVPTGLPQRARNTVSRTSTVAAFNRISAPSGSRVTGERGNDGK